MKGSALVTVQGGPPGASRSCAKSNTGSRASASPLAPTLRTGGAGSFASTPIYERGHCHPAERLRALFILVTSVACARELTLPTTDISPEFLGPFSGVFRAIDDRVEGESGTIVVQFRDGVMVAPYDLEAGVPTLEIFATTLALPDARSERVAFAGGTDLRLDVADVYSPGATCSDSAPLPQTAEEFFGMLQACAAAGSCTIPCFLSTSLALADGLQAGDAVAGVCTEEGTVCVYAGRTFGGTMEPTHFDLYFPSLALLPPSRQVVPCPDADPAWARCFHYEKTCAFEPRLAGVYRLALTFEADESDAAAANRELDVAIAADFNLAAAALFTGECPYFGTLDPFTLELNLERSNLGSGDLCDEYVQTTIHGRLVESGELVQLSGTWVEGDAASGYTAFRMEGVRRSGTTAGHTCEGGTCRTRPVICPAGLAEPPGQDLILTTRLDDAGCPVTECVRSVERTGLCAGADAALACAGALRIGPPGSEILLATGRAEMSCRTSPSPCAITDQCLDLQCDSTDPLREAFFVEADCGGGSGPLLLSFDFFGELSIACP